MAVRSQDLIDGSDAVVLAFPTDLARERARRRRRVEGRRRLLVSIAGLALAGGVIVGSGGSSVSSRPGAPQRVVVRAGQSLWDLADRYAPDGVDKRAYVGALQSLNSLAGTPLPGQELRLPR